MTVGSGKMSSEDVRIMSHALQGDSDKKEDSSFGSSALANCKRIAFRLDTSKIIKSSKQTGFRPSAGIEGTYKIIDASSAGKKWDKEGKDLPMIASLDIKCKNREMGDFRVTLKSPSGDAIASFERNKARGLFAHKDADTEIPVRTPDGAVFATLKPDMVAGKCTRIYMGEGENPRVSFKMWLPTWQAQTKWCLFSFLCFLPTFGLGGCFGFYKMSKAKKVHRLEKHDESGRKSEDLADVTRGAVDFEGASTPLDWREKFALMLLYAFVEADDFVEPPPSTNV